MPSTGVIIGIVVFCFVIGAVVYYFATRKEYSLDTKNYGSKELISKTMTKRDPSKNQNQPVFKFASTNSLPDDNANMNGTRSPTTTPNPFTTPGPTASPEPTITPGPSFPPIFPDPTLSEELQPKLTELKENIRAATGAEFEMCNFGPGNEIYNYFGMVNNAIRKLLNMEPPRLYDIGALFIPLFELTKSFQMVKSLKVTYEPNNKKLVKSIKMIWNRDLYHGFDKSEDPSGDDSLAIAPFLNLAITSWGKFSTANDLGRSGDNDKRYVDGTWGGDQPKSSIIKLIEEKVLRPFQLNHFDGLSQRENSFKYDIDPLSFTKIMFVILYNPINKAGLLYDANPTACAPYMYTSYPTSSSIQSMVQIATPTPPVAQGPNFPTRMIPRFD